MGLVEDELKQLKDVVGTLESRIKSLEQRATGTSTTTQELRMLLIGPPGAGTLSIGLAGIYFLPLTVV